MFPRWNFDCSELTWALHQYGNRSLGNLNLLMHVLSNLHMKYLFSFTVRFSLRQRKRLNVTVGIYQPSKHCILDMNKVVELLKTDVF